MKKMFFAVAALVASMTAVTSCSSDEMKSETLGQKGNTISLTSTIQTRATSDPQTTQISTNVTVGAFGVANDATITNGDNNQYAVETTGTLTATNDMTWPTEGSVNIYAYAPYQAGWTYNGDNAFAVATDQTTEAGYLASDLVYGTPASNPVAQTEDAVALSFRHQLAKINITVQKVEGSTLDLTDASVSIINTKVATTLNPSTGTLGEATGSAADIKAVTALGEATTVCAIIVPQQIAANTQLVKIVAGDKTLIAKVGTATTFVGGKAYNFTVKVGTTPTPVTEVTLKLGSTAVVDWGSEDMGAATGDEKVEYGVGDYVLTDGTFVKADAITAEQKSSIAGIIFSTTVSTADAAAGYDAYVMGLNRQKMAFHISADYPSQMVTSNKINDLADAIVDLDGLTRTTTMVASDYYTNLTDKSTSMINLDWYSVTKNKAISANASVWYLPSFGQLVQIMNNLGGANFTTYDFGEGSFTSSATYTVGDADALTTMAAKIQAYVTAAGGQGDMFAVGNINYPSSTENGSSSNSHYGKVFSINFTSSAGWNFGKALGRTDSPNYSVIPVAAVSLPTE